MVSLRSAATAPISIAKTPSERILGVSIVGAGAGELIAGGVLGIEMGGGGAAL